MILQLIKSLYAHDVIYDLPLSVFCGCNFWKEISSKSKILYPVKLFDIWIPQTVTCQKLEAKLLRFAFANNEIAYWKHVLHWNRKEMKNENRGILKLCLTSTRHFWKMYRKWKFTNFQIYDIYDFFSLQKDEIYQKPSKFYSLYSMT